MSSDDLIVRREGAAGILSLNRPKALHALTHGIVTAMTEALLAWRDDPSVEVAIIDHAEGRGFCAGGDIASLRRSAMEDAGAAARRFFFDEYRLNHLMFHYAKPVVAFMDGVTMGGGAGIALPAKFRVATENTRFAMPETGIGFFPDVGGGWYLSRLAGRLGPFLALTGARLDGAECLWVGLATHYLPSAASADAKTRIAADPDRMAAVLDDLAVPPPPAWLADNAPAIARLFAADSYEDILAALEADGGQWATTQLATLSAKSPLSQKVALRQLAEGSASASFAEDLEREYRIAARVVVRPDFAEGVRATIVDKDGAPRWNPASPAEASVSLVDAIFAPLPGDEAWTPL